MRRLSVQTPRLQVARHGRRLFGGSGRLSSSAAGPSPRGAEVERPRHDPPKAHPIRQRKPFAVNEDAQKLMDMYRGFVGEEPKLPLELAWQAVTHKSYRHGFLPYNERLAMDGRRVLTFHAALHWIQKNPKARTAIDGWDVDALRDDQFGDPVDQLFQYRNLCHIGRQFGVPQVMRWKPRVNENLATSGEERVVAEVVAAIVGAVNAYSGGHAAKDFVHSRILPAVLEMPRRRS